MQKKTFVANAVLLTAFSLLARTIGMSFRVYLAGKIGAEGIGLFQLISTIFFFTSTFAVSGISLAVTRLVTDELAKGNRNTARAVVVRCLFLSLGMSLLAAAVLLFGAPGFAAILKDERVTLPLRLLAPALPFMAVSACFRGYFYAVRKVLKTASEQLLEQVVEIGIFVLLAGWLVPKGIGWACCALVIGTTLAEVVSCGYSYWLYRLEVGRKRSRPRRIPGLFRKICSICIPVTASSCLRSGLSMVENMLIPAGLKRNGETYESSLQGYGMLTGMVMPVITFPSAFLSSFSMLLIPELSEANAKHHKQNIRHITTRVFQLTLHFAIPITGIFFFFANDFSLLIYGDATSGKYIALMSLVIPLMYLDHVADGMLKGLNEQLSYLSYNMVDSCIRVVLIIFLLPVCGLWGLIIVIFVSEILNSTLSIARLVKVAKLTFLAGKWILKPILCILLPCLLLRILEIQKIFCFPNLFLQVVAEAGGALFLYLILLRITCCVEREDLSWLRSIFAKHR